MHAAQLKQPKAVRTKSANRTVLSVLINWRHMVQLPTGLEPRMPLGQRVYFLVNGDRLIVQARPVLWSDGVSTRVRRCVARTGLSRAIARGLQ
jgi:hypothetical protein